MRPLILFKSLIAAGLAMLGISLCSCDKVNENNGDDEKIEYTVIFDLNGAIGSVPEKVMVEAGCTVLEAPEDPFRDGYEFGGWFTEKSCTNEFIFGPDGTQVNKDMTLYAKWTEIAVEYTVVFDLNGFEGTAPDPIKVTEGSTVENEPKVPVVPDYIFIGWYTDQECRIPFVFGENGTEVVSDITLYAKWEENIFTYVDGTGDFAGGVLVTGIKEKFLPDAAEIHIPDIIDGKPVFAICSAEGQTAEIPDYDAMAKGAFEYNQYIRKVTVGKNVKQIWFRAFRGANNLSEIIFDEGSTLEIIGIGAFAECRSLAEISLPGSLIAINGWSKGAFFDCVNLVSLVMEPKTTREDKVPFLSTDNNQMPFVGAPVVITVPEEEEADYLADPNWSKFSERINPSETALEQPVFVKDGTVTGFTPNGMNQTDLVIASSIDGKAITAFSADAFSNNATIQSLTFEGGDILFNVGAFVNQQALKTLRFAGDAPVEIKAWAFTNCNVLETIEFSSMTPPVIEGCGLKTDDGKALPKVTAIYVPAGATDAYMESMPEYSSVIQAKQ